MICGNCGAANAPENEYCYACGQDLASRLKVHETVCANHPDRLATSACTICGLELCEVCERFVDDSIYCHNCVERPAESEVLEEVDAPQVVVQMFASLEWRALSGFLDWVVFWGGAVALDVVQALVSRDLLVPCDPGHPWFGVYWLTVLAGAAAYSIGFIGVWGQTPGMSAVDLMVVQPDGSRAGWSRAAVRFFAFIPSTVLVFGLFMPLWDVKRRMWHDKVARTMVVKVEVEE